MVTRLKEDAAKLVCVTHVYPYHLVYSVLYVAAGHDMAFAFLLPPAFSRVCSVALLPKQEISPNIWQKHDKQSILSDHEPMQPPQSQDALPQRLLYTGDQNVS